MASSSWLSLPLWLFLLMFFCISFTSSTGTVLGSSTSSTDEGNYKDIILQRECLTTPTSVFLKSVRLAIEEVEKVTSIVSKFTGAFSHHNFRLSHAVIDCLDLLDFTSEELTWTLYAAQHLLHNPQTHTNDMIPNSTANAAGTWWRQSTWKNRGRKEGRPSKSTSRLLADDLRSWLSAALGNQDTCIEGFEKTGTTFVQNMIAGGLNHVTSLVSDVLAMVHHEEYHQRHQNRSSNGQMNNYKVDKRGRKHSFPSWMHIRDRRLLQLTPPTINNNGSTVNATNYSNMTINVVVAADGSGNFTKIMDAVSAAPDKSTNRFIIYIKRGIYNENVDIKKKKWNLMMIGDGMKATVITGNRSYIDGWTTFRTATFAVSGRGFIARDLTIENTAGAVKHQAVALRSDSDLSVFYRCGIKGYQDTLYAHSLRQFYRECIITGTVDFIFGNGAAVFQKCNILARQALPDQKNSVTAQGRKDPNQNTGFSIQFSKISADSDLAAAASVPSNNTSSNITTRATQTYLGRPWKLYSRTVIMKCYMGELIRPEGWLEWNGTFALDTLFYAEYMNYGPGAGLGIRVNWPGYQVMNDSSQAINFTVARFIDGNSWLPSTGITYISGLDM